MEKEIFKDIPEYEGVYQVSNFGNVKSLPRFRKTGTVSGGYITKEKILKKTIFSNGYIVATLINFGKTKKISVHQLVAMAFLNHRPNGFDLVVDHINDIKTDNRLENLRLVTNRENASKKQRGTSKYTGVYFSFKNKKWVSAIYINGKTIFLGQFSTEHEASQSYQNKLLTLNK
jgi:hypothetical protein